MIEYKARKGDVQTKTEYVIKLSQWSRGDLLKTCRAAGLTAHRLRSNEQLAELLWDATAPMREMRNAKKS